MCKFGSETDEGYDVALMNIRQMIVLAKGKPRARNVSRKLVTQRVFLFGWTNDSCRGIGPSTTTTAKS